MQLVYGCSIHKRLEGRTCLACALYYLVILEVLVVDTSYPSFYMPCLRLHRHHSCTQKRLVVQYRIARRHYSIALSAPAKHTHFYFFIKRCSYFGFRIAQILHMRPAVGVFHRFFYQVFILLFGYFHKRIGTILFAVIFGIKSALQLSHMHFYSCFGISLHF